MKGAIDITSKQRKLLLKLIEKHPPNTTVLAYGSRLKWNARPASDLVAFATPDQHMQVEDLREDLESSDLPFRVDLFIWDDVPESFRKNIRKEYAELVKKEEREGWEIVSIDDIAEVIGGGTPSSSISEYWGKDIPWITPKDLSGYAYRKINKGARSLTKEGLAKSSARMLPKGSVLLTSRAPIGYVAIADNELCTNQDFKSLIPKNGYDSNFLYYLLKHNISKLENLGSGTTFKEISASTLRRFCVTLPSLPEQRAIAHILGTLDDKIELNRRMSETLEAMAQRLFKSWFVDFDSVIDNALDAGKPIPEELQARAKLRKSLGDARKPLPEDVRKLFPCEFEQTEEMGWIQRGWKNSSVGEEFEVTMGQSPSSETHNSNASETPFFQGNADFGFRYPSKKVYCTKPKRIAKKDDALISVRAPVGSINMAFEKCCIGRGLVALKHKSRSRAYTYHAAQQLKNTFKNFESTGTVFGSMNKQDLKKIKWLSLNFNIIKKYDLFSEESEKMIELHYKSILNLTKLRNTLLPELFSE